MSSLASFHSGGGMDYSQQQGGMDPSQQGGMYGYGGQGWGQQ